MERKYTKIKRRYRELMDLGKSIFPLGFCEVCWTHSWAPVSRKHPHAQRVRSKAATLIGSNYVVCRMCQAEREIERFKKMLKV